MLERITQVTDEEFKAYIESVRQKKLVKRISFDDEIKHYFEELQNQQFVFDRSNFQCLISFNVLIPSSYQMKEKLKD